MFRAFFYTIFFILGTGLLFSNYAYKNDMYYDSIYKESVLLIKNDKVNEAILFLKEINNHYKYTLYHETNINAHYDLGQIYLSRIADYELANFHFDFIFKNLHSRPFKKNKLENVDSYLKNSQELRLKSLFMLGYIYHNHLGNFTRAQKYYKLFLDQYKDTELTSSVMYELELINKAINDFNQINK